MNVSYLGTIVKLLRSSVAALACLLFASCSLIGSPNEGEDTRSLVPPQPVEVNIVGHDNYIESCRAKGVPIPPDWKPSSEWESHGNLKTILLTPNNLDQVPADDTSFASVWSYAPPQGRGACIALGRNGGSFQIICQSATTGHACFWGNDPTSPETRWTPETAEVPIASLRDPIQGFAPNTVPCTECHRGNNAFLYAPDDPTWATVLRPEHVRPTFTTRVEQSSHHGQLTFGTTTTTYPRFIPIGGRSVALNNPLPTTPGCSGSCHESHLEILGKNHTVEGYVRIPRPMGPKCADNSPPDDPTKNCYQRYLLHTTCAREIEFFRRVTCDEYVMIKPSPMKVPNAHRVSHLSTEVLNSKVEPAHLCDAQLKIRPSLRACTPTPRDLPHHE